MIPIGALATWAWWTAAALDPGALASGLLMYGTGRPLAPGVRLATVDLLGALRRLAYQEVAEPRPGVGQFRRHGARWDLHLRPRDDPGGARPALAVRLVEEDGRIVSLTAHDGRTLDVVELEPEPLRGLGEAAMQLRLPVSLATLPAHVVQAILAAEDHRFFEHRGVDLRAVLRAGWVNLRQGAVIQGGSTLTQQLVKNVLLTPGRTWTRKIREAALALALEQRHGKDEILAAYVNGVYLGHHGGFAVHGVGAAARSYFGKEPGRLSLAEAALLAGIIRAPNTHSPVHHAERARERRDGVLRRMRALGMIDARRLAAARSEAVAVRRGTPPLLSAPYFADHVRVQMEALVAAGERPATGLRVYTTLDPVLQAAAETAVTRGLSRLEAQHPHLRRGHDLARLQAALVALDPRTGEVRAMLGGRDYAQSQFNRAAQARRQPGSAFKPFVYLAALAEGPRGEPPRFTPASLVEDRPLTIGTGREAWTPRNHDGRYAGRVTVRHALEHSLNAATVAMAQAVGWDAVVRVAREAGIQSPLAPRPAVVLGSFEVVPLELAASYAVFANGGQRVAATGLHGVVDRAGEVSRQPIARTPVFRPAETYLVAHLLAGVIERGTGAPVRALGVGGPVAGKTGTTNEGRDAWFVGFTSELVALVWVGFDEGDGLRLSGAQAALPIWADFMRVAADVHPARTITPPATVTFRDVDPGNGQLATRWCPITFREAFLAGTEPSGSCPDHGPLDALRSLFRRFFR